MKSAHVSRKPKPKARSDLGLTGHGITAHPGEFCLKLACGGSPFMVMNSDARHRREFATENTLGGDSVVRCGPTTLCLCLSANVLVRFHFALPRFSELPVHPLYDTFWDSQRGIASLKPCFTVLPLDYPRFVAENTPDCPFA